MKIQNFKPAKAKKLLNKILLSSVVFLFSLKSYAADYYWVGGTGNWNDFANHWATASGGTTFHTANPGPLDDVYFDSNSFPSLNDTVIVNSVNDIYCKNFDWSGVSNHPTFTKIATLGKIKMYGAFILDSNMTWINSGVLEFLSLNTNNIIKTNGNLLSSTSVVFNNPNGQWILMDDLFCDGITISSGEFNTNKKNIYCSNLSAGTMDSLNFIFKNSIITCSDNFHIEQSFGQGIFKAEADSSIINAVYFNVDEDSIDFNVVNCENDVWATECHFNKINSVSLTGTKNFIKEYYAQAVNNPSFSFHNHFVKAAFYGPNCNIGGNNDFDTAFFNSTVTAITSDTMTIFNLLIINSSALNPVNLSGCIFKNSDTVCLDNLYLTNSHAIGGAQFFAGANSLDLGGNLGWQFTSCSVVTDVWPGDANYDLTANNNDVLNIGLAYGETGPVRAGASNTWVAQPATDWSSFFQSAVNKKHADCDGNGVVDNNDTLAISLNYGLTHPARLANPNSNLSTSAPQLYLVANPDTVMEGDTLEVDIYLGTQLIPVDSIYGIAFTINFDTALVDTSWMPFDFTGSWMGTPGVDLLPFDHKLFLQGQADVALTRTDHTNANGYGYLGKMGIVIVANVGTQLTSTPPYVTLPLSFSNVEALTATEFYLTISTSTENIEIDTSGITGIHQHLNDAPFSVYPNPVRTKLTVNSYWLKGETSCTVELYNVIGEKVISKQVPVSQNRFSIDVSALPQDMYFIKVIASKGTVNKKILVVKK